MTLKVEKPVRRKRFWRILRVYFRRFRIAVWLLVLLLLGVLIYLNQVGLPSVVKRPLLQKLRARGLDLQFSRLRLRWHQGIVAEKVRFGRAGDPASPQLTLEEVQLLLNFKALTRLELQVDQLALNRGRLLFPVISTNQNSRQLSVENIRSYLRFLPNDQWALDDFRASFAGATVELSGIVTNASAVGDWTFFHGQRTEPKSSAAWGRRLHRLADVLEQIHFSASPKLRLEVRGDARDLQSFSVRLFVEAPAAETPWGILAGGEFSARLFPAGKDGASRGELSLQAATANTRWTAVTNLNLDVTLVSSAWQTNLINGDLKLSAESVHSRWASASNPVFSASWVHAVTNPVPFSGQGRFACERAEAKWGSARAVNLAGSLVRPPPEELPACDAAWAWWTNLQPYALRWECRLSGVQSSDISSESLSFEGNWRAPNLSLSNVDIRLSEGSISADAEMDVLTRNLEARINSDFDPRNAGAVLTQGARKWLDQFSWEAAPRVSAQARVVLPAWTNAQPDWRGEVQPTLALNGEFTVGPASYRQVQVTAAHSHFIYSNLCWHLPDLDLKTTNGGVRAEHIAHDRTKDFYWRIESDADLRSFRHLFPTNAQRTFDQINFTNSPVIHGRLWGRAREPQRTGFQGRVALTNFAFRGQAANWVETALEYTNRILRLYRPQARRASQHASADGLTADFGIQKIYLTNGFSTFEPKVVATAIGPKITRAIEPYRFALPPTGRVRGVIPMRGEEGADLHFDLEGGPFSWWKFHVPQIAGHVHWAGLRLFLNDVRVSLYGGEAAGSAQFTFLPRKQGTEFGFNVTTTNTLLHDLMADLSSPTNQLDGLLHGTVTVTNANTSSWTSVFGYGDAELRDGLLWDIPLFGVAATVLNGISPGLGNYRAGAGTGTFTITNGVIRSNDLEIRSPAVRLQYRGTVDLEGRLKARVEAELLRDMWLVGPVVSTVLWPVTKMFEYKVDGTLSEPKLEPVYIVPKLLLMPFRPFRALKSLLPQDSTSRTNSSQPVFQDLNLDQKR